MSGNRKSHVTMTFFLLLSVLLIPQQFLLISGETESHKSSNEILSASYFDLWSSVTDLSIGSAVHSLRPELAIDPSNNVHVIWQELFDLTGTSGTDYDIFHRYWNETTTSWSSIELVSVGSNGASEAPRVVADESGNLHAVWFDWPTDSDINYAFWDAQTQIWSAPIEVESASTANSLWPDITIKNGDLFLVWQDLTNMLGAGGDHDLFFKRRFSNGTWSSTELITTESSGVSRFPSIFVDEQENIFVSWDDATAYSGSGGDQDIFFKMKSASTGIWSTTEVISTGDSLNSDRSKIIVDEDDNRHIVWQNFIDVTYRDVFYRMWNASTSSWESIEEVSTESNRNSEVPEIVLDEYGSIHCFWFDETDYAGAGGDQDIFYKVKNVNTQNWQNLTVLTAGSFQNSWRPVVSIDSFNQIHLVWMDGVRGADVDIHYSYGIDTSTIMELSLIYTPEDLTYEVNTTGNSLSWTLQDDNISTTHYTVTRNGTDVQNGSWVSLNAITLDVDDLDLGTYEFVLNATDGLDNYVQDTVYVFVVQDLPSTFDWDFITNMAFGFVIAAAVVIGSMAFSGARRK